MDMFEYRNKTLLCEKVKVEDIISDVGTPAYVYSKNSIVTQYHALETAFRAVDTLICFSVKSNSNLSICKLLAGEGSGFDVVSGGELFRAIRAGGDPSKIVFAGVGKTYQELRYALENDIFMFNVESLAELERINTLAGETGKIPKVALRINPDIDAKTHAKTTTGKKENKFGIDFTEAERIIKQSMMYPSVDLCGLHVHLGSPIYTVDPYVHALKKIVTLINKCRDAGLDIRYMNIGGGYCISYTGENVIQPQDYASQILPLVKEMQCNLIMEPGRFIMGNSGILITRVIYTKETPHGKKFVICDAAMNDLVRPALYDAFHRIWPVNTNIKMPKVENPDKPVTKKGIGLVDIVGPVCESSDVFATKRALPSVREGDLLAIYSAGAYGFSMSSNYNSRPRPCEVLVDGDQYHVIRERETYEDLVRGENFV
ncbi:MAG: diaminopimelate decarboxylase [Planctomycetia bacterium]|nr:diaminopimelate decarboxylase [Candidatus Brocadia sp.]QOJ06320.1 MAG: diaminopimelate decarboxylase [Planctomycetia bacterium]TVL95391.1 MAG: diaminopimelate decarboxylase [Candidatus Brocadia sp. BL1]HQU31670.1 diaminopimelate decarboxylase [Candidatus Brocadia sapporoensis]